MWVLVSVATVVLGGWTPEHAPAAGRYGQHVDTFIGTGGAGFGIGSTPPGAQTPFGLVRASPDTTGLIYEPFNHFGGYYYDDALDGKLRAFSHMHMQGAGVPDLGLVGVMLARDKPNHDCVLSFDGCWASRFSHERELAFPGYYAVHLEDPDAVVELTAGSNVAAHRYSLAQGKADPTYLVLAPQHSVKKGSVRNATLAIDTQGSTISFSGSLINAGSLSARGGVPGGGIQVFFSGILVAPQGCVTGAGLWDNKGELGPAGPGHTGMGGWIELASDAACESQKGSLQLFLGLSLISEDQAATNLKAEMPQLSFDILATSTLAAWETALGNAAIVEDGSGDPDAVTKYYTLLYHTHNAPTSYTEAGGLYMGFDLQVHTLEEGHEHYASDMSIWDIFRAQISVLALLQPEYLGDVIHSLDLMRAQGGSIPRWPLAYVPTGCMIGSHADFMVAEAWAKGVRNFNLSSLYAGFKDIAMGTSLPYGGRSDAADYISKGYVCSDKSGSSVSRTLAYASDDWMISNIAGYLGLTSDQEYFYQRSQTHFVSLFSSERNIFCGKTCSGTVVCPHNDWDWGKLFTEGNARQWRYWVPQNGSTLVRLMGGPDAYLKATSEFLLKSFDDPATILPNPWYWAGNEPDLLAPWQPMYVPQGGPALTQEVTRKIFDKVLTAKPDGIPGNDDYGAESASFLHAALGFYPLSGTDEYFLGSPRFNRVHLVPSNTTIIRTAPSPTSYLVDHVLLNGQRLSDLTIRHHQLTNAVLEFVFQQ